MKPKLIEVAVLSCFPPPMQWLRPSPMVVHLVRHPEFELRPRFIWRRA